VINKNDAFFDFLSFFLNKTKSTALKAFNLGFTVSICFGSLDIKKTSTFHLKIYNLIFKKQV